MRNQRMVVCAAIRSKLTGDVIVGARHYDEIMQKQIECNDNFAWCHIVEQGFIDQQGVFMTREEAWKVAEAAGQIRYRVGGDGEKLYSENLY